jgi:hypothetical protein
VRDPCRDADERAGDGDPMVVADLEVEAAGEERITGRRAVGLRDRDAGGDVDRPDALAGSTT